MALVNGSRSTILRQATSAWGLLNGVICVYKQPGISVGATHKILKNKICQGTIRICV